VPDDNKLVPTSINGFTPVPNWADVPGIPGRGELKALLLSGLFGYVTVVSLATELGEWAVARVLVLPI
jgi:hypothetical protein